MPTPKVRCASAQFDDPNLHATLQASARHACPTGQWKLAQTPHGSRKRRPGAKKTKARKTWNYAETPAWARIWRHMHCDGMARNAVGPTRTILTRMRRSRRWRGRGCAPTLQGFPATSQDAAPYGRPRAVAMTKRFTGMVGDTHARKTRNVPLTSS